MSKSSTDFVQDVEGLRASCHNVYMPGRESRLSSRAAEELRKVAKLEWNEVRFSESNVDQVPHSHGLYMFILRRHLGLAPVNGIVLYIGITGKTRSRTRHLRVRYTEYLREAKSIKRSRIFYMLNNWGGDLSFCFAEVKDKRISLSKMETRFLDAFMPRYNERDFSAKIRPRRRAAF